MWEDEQCKDGGRLTIRFPKTHMNKYWEDVVLALIGEQLGEENEILGLQLAIRPMKDQLSVWVRHGAEQQKVEQVKRDLERVLKLDESTQAIVSIDYEVFAEMLQKRPQDNAAAAKDQSATAFNRNIPKATEGEEEQEKQNNRGEEQEFGGFERGQISRGGGFTRGRGRGRGDAQGGNFQTKRGGNQGGEW